jgi:hypothetical protein
MVVHVRCKLLFSMFHLFFIYVASVFIWMLYMFSHRWCKFFYLDVAYVYNSCKCFSSVSDACFIYFQMYAVIVASGCFKTRSSITSPSPPLWCLASVLDARKRRRSPLAWGRPHVLASGHSRRDVDGQMQDARWGQRRGRPNEGLASGRVGASHYPANSRIDRRVATWTTWRRLYPKYSYSLIEYDVSQNKIV